MKKIFVISNKFIPLMLIIMFSVVLLMSGCSKDLDINIVDLKDQQITLFVGQESKVEVLQEGTYSYKSTSDSVSVDAQGNVTANSIGSAIIIVSSEDGKELGSCVVVVNSNKPIDVTSLTINNQITELTVGSTHQLNYTKVPENADNYNSLKWESSNEVIATVSNDGLVKAVSPGTITISLKATGTTILDEFSIKVIANESYLSLDYTDVFGVTNTSDLTITPLLVTDYLDVAPGKWVTSDENIVTIDSNGKVSFKNLGKATLTYSVEIDGKTLSSVCKVCVGEMDGYTIIRTPEQLQNIGNISGNYALGNDIDLEEACSKDGILYHSGAGFSPLFSSPTNSFSGTFNGLGYAIKNIYIKTNTAYTALFGYVNVNSGSEGKIINLSLEGGRIEGFNFTSAFIANVAGSGSADAGIKNCWSDVELVANGNCSGLVGYNGGLIENCYTLSKITATSQKCSIALMAKNNVTTIGARNTYANSDIQTFNLLIERPYTSIVEAEYKTTAEMKTASLYDSWDKTIWKIVDGEYPTLLSPNEK